ncbi:uncharacterized protein LODBEIA_P55540 [Lodderomyces beijingensis]|uniref:NADH dehydrogenase [ubiquinone] 1 alpha subcomplex subunit n=1 Tax=Lodderomyces beijingensis TaxID=1775926 RepID=A0ABP0ZVG9_9ASCO
MDIIRQKYSPLRIKIHQFQSLKYIPGRRKFFVGYDLHGNTYWEFAIEKITPATKLRRKMEPWKPQLFEVDYFKTVPPQWLQWLRRTRDHVPTLAELIEDERRRERMKVLSLVADDKWRSEKARLEVEEREKLQRELDRVSGEAQGVDTGKLPKVESDDPWRLADESRDQDPIQSTTIKPR